MRNRLLVTQRHENGNWYVHDYALDAEACQPTLRSRAHAVQLALDLATRFDGHVLAVVPIGEEVGVVCELK